MGAYMSSLNDILGPIYPIVTIIINMYNMYIYVESISQSHMTYTIEEILYSRVTMIIYIYNIYIYVESISLSHMTLHNTNIYITN